MRISREGFNKILSQAMTGQDEKAQGMKEKSCVRLQWDPDHDPTGAPEKRRAIQLGLRNKVKRFTFSLKKMLLWAYLFTLKVGNGCEGSQ